VRLDLPVARIGMLPYCAGRCMQLAEDGLRDVEVVFARFQPV